MCDALSAVAVLASTALAAKSANDQKKAAREAREIEQEAANRQKAALERKGPEAVSSKDTAAADEERRRRTAVRNSTNILTSRTGALGSPNVAGTSLTGTAIRNTMG